MCTEAQKLVHVGEGISLVVLEPHLIAVCSLMKEGTAPAEQPSGHHQHHPRRKAHTKILPQKLRKLTQNIGI